MLAADPDPKKGRGALDTAVEFLREVLANGPMKVTEIYAEAEGAGLKPRTIVRAKEELKIKSKKVGFGNEEGTFWAWILPEAKF